MAETKKSDIEMNPKNQCRLLMGSKMKVEFAQFNSSPTTLGVTSNIEMTYLDIGDRKLEKTKQENSSEKKNQMDMKNLKNQ